MQALRERIQKDGQNLGGGILKVDGFVNHQVDPALMDACGRELASRFKGLGATKVLTAEISGIAPALTTALHLGIPVVYARKHKPITMPDQVFLTLAPSHTKGRSVELIVSPEYLTSKEKVLVIDDFLASGATIMGLARLAQTAGAQIVGIGALIEKTFEKGREALEVLGVPVVSLVAISRMEGKTIEFQASAEVVAMIAVLDFGSQTSQLIARRLREAQVYCQLFPCDTPAGEVLAHQPAGFVLSGGPASVYAPGAPQLPDYVIASGKPVLGICYGMQALTHALGGKVAPSGQREFGAASIHSVVPNPLLNGSQPVWMSHGDCIDQVPHGFAPIASSENAPIAAMADLDKKLFGVQFHPEVQHTPGGTEILRRFAVDVCGATATWTPQNIVEESIDTIRQKVGKGSVLAAISGGVDSSVAAALVHRAIGDQLVALFVDNGLLRHGERQQVTMALQAGLGIELVVVDAADEFLGALSGVTDPEQKRRIIGERFIRLFEAQAKALGNPRFLVQGTIYPDVIESRAPERSQAQRIKTHHNVGGLPEHMDFELVEPLRYLFKDEVRRVGLSLGLPAALVWRQPFPGPGLAVRCLGEITAERLERLRRADAIFTSELERAGLLGRAEAALAQAFAVLLPVHSVGVMGDQRTYQECVALRAVSSQDYMTADWARLPQDLLAKVSSRIVNEVDGVNRVVYDVSTKPPATIEWE